MRKSTVFISAVLTTFALVLLYSLVSAYRGNKNVVEAAALPTATRTPEATDTPVPTEMIITPEEAAQLAAQVVGHDNLLSAESSNINGLDAYKITFTNNDVVYIAQMDKYSLCRSRRSSSILQLRSNKKRTITTIMAMVVEMGPA